MRQFFVVDEEASVRSTGAEPRRLGRRHAGPIGTRLLVNEHSEALVRIHEGQAAARRLGHERSSLQLDGYEIEHDFARRVVASVFNVALQDIKLSIDQLHPRALVKEYRHRRELLPNEHFDSAVRFFFEMEPVSVLTHRGGPSVGWYSPMGAYCALMGWPAPAFRERILELYPRLRELIPEIIPIRSHRAPVRGTTW